MHLLSPGLRAQIVKEFLSLLRDPRARFILIGPPLVQLLVFAFAATLEVRNATVAVFDRDGGAASQELVAAVGAASFVGMLRPVHDRAALHRMIEERQALLALEIPETFSRQVAAGMPAEVRVVIDGRRAYAGQIALSYLETVAAGAAVDATAVRHWFNPNLTYRWFIVPSLAGSLAMLVSLMVSALSIARERELGTLDQLLVSPAKPADIIIAKAAPGMALGSALGMLMAAAAALLFSVPFHGSVLLLWLAMLLFILAVIGIGLAISAVCATQQQALLAAFALAVPMILLSGFATPVENMPEALQWLAEADPLKHFLVIVQGSFLKGLPAIEIWRNAWPLLVIAGAGLALAAAIVHMRR